MKKLMPVYLDQLNNSVFLESLPNRIISLVPSQTELLYDLGLDDEVVGTTKFCTRPRKWFEKKDKVGGTKKLNFGRIHELKPDLIIANKEENSKEQIDKLAEKYPVWISDVKNLHDAIAMINSIGEITQKRHDSKRMVLQISKNFENLKPLREKLGVTYLIWQDPLMAAGGDTFINDMLTRCGFQNVFGNVARYPTISAQDIIAGNCEVLLASSEPFPFSERHVAGLQGELPGIEIIRVDGQMFSWYGSRMIYAPEYFGRIISRIRK